MESITPWIKRRCFSFTFPRPENNIGKCMVENRRRYRPPKSRLRRCSRQNNSQCSCIGGNVNTSAHTSPRCAASQDVSVCQMGFWFDKFPPLATISATNGFHWCVLRSCVPGNARILWRIVFTRCDVTRAPNSSTAITEECVDDRHHSSPQHTAHFPLLCFGLHLFFSIP
jgi:hypothetical protein